MQTWHIIIIILVFLCYLGTVFSANLASEYDHFVGLDPLEKMKLYWSVDHSDKRISFAVEARTTGWVGLGFSTAGRMEGADVVIGWVKGGEARLTNRHAVGHSLPLMDDDQSTYELQSGTEVNGSTTLKFRRKFDTCSKQDRVIERGTTKVIFAYNDKDPTSDNDMSKHSFRGAKSLLLLSYGKKTEPDPNWDTFDLLMSNISVPKAKTSYICQTFQAPVFSGKRQAVRFEPVVQRGNEGVVHHLVVYQCHPRTNVTYRRASWTKHFRNGEELPELARDNYYDFNFQEIQVLPKERHIRPGDDLIHYCRYNTMDRDKATYGGFSTTHEMCLNFIMYYPRIQQELLVCSTVDLTPTYKFLVKHFPSLAPMSNRYYNPMVIKPNMTWTAETVNELKDAISDAKRVYIEHCSPDIPFTFPLTNLTDKMLQPKVSVIKPLGPPVSDCETSSAHALRSHGVLLLVFGAWLIVVD